jgi:hypothetical protein
MRSIPYPIVRRGLYGLWNMDRMPASILNNQIKNTRLLPLYIVIIGIIDSQSGPQLSKVGPFIIFSGVLLS